MNRIIGLCAAGWAAAWIWNDWHDALHGALLGVACIGLAPLAVWALLQRRRRSTGVRAADAEASAWAGLGLALVICAGTDHAQATNAFGATIRNPGSVMPEWWNEVAYIPDQLDGALHLRAGSAGNMGGQPMLGRPNCDLPLLYAAKSGIPLTASETEYCALLEFELYRGVTGDPRNVNDLFVRRDVIAEFARVLDKRLELFKRNDLYYLRAAAAQFDPFDLKSGGMVMRFNWTQGYIPANPAAGRPQTILYKFDEPHFRREDDRWWGVQLQDDEAGGRELEAARTTNKFIPALNLFRFAVTGTRESHGPSGTSRYVKVEVKRFAVPYVRPDGSTVVTGTGQ